MTRAQPLLWTIALLATIAALALAKGAGFAIDYTSLLPFSCMTGLLAAVFAVYKWIRPVPLIASILGMQTAVLWALPMIGMAALAGLGLRAALIDDLLIKADASLGLDVRSTVEWIADWPVALSVLSFVYQASVPLAVVSPIALCLSSRNETAWKVSACLVGSGLVCSVIAAFLPAIGAFPALNVPPETLARLPAGAGTYHLTTFEALHGGKVRQIDISMLNGVVTFPSFHAAMAMAIAHSGIYLKRLRSVAMILATLVMISTVPIGGHYYVDVLGGIAIYLAFAGLIGDGTEKRWQSPFGETRLLVPAAENVPGAPEDLVPSAARLASSDGSQTGRLQELPQNGLLSFGRPG